MNNDWVTMSVRIAELEAALKDSAEGYCSVCEEQYRCGRLEARIAELEALLRGKCNRCGVINPHDNWQYGCDGWYVERIDRALGDSHE